MGRSVSASRRVVVVLATLTASLVACRAFVDLDGLGSGPATDGSVPDTTSDVAVAPSPDVTDSDGEVHPNSLDGATTIIDASDDVPVFDVDASKPCPSTGGPMVRIATSTGSFCIDETEVTRGDYAAFLSTSPPTNNQGAFCGWNASYLPIVDWPPDINTATYPVGGVDWCDAQAFCKWAGKRLCGKVGGGALTVLEAQTLSNEWIFTCTGAGTRKYPYGNTYDKNKCNGGETDPFVGLEKVKSRNECVVSGVYDLAGNEHELVDSCVVTGTPEADQCVLQESAYDGHPEADMECTRMGTWARNQAHSAVSFRCCAD